MKTAKLKEKVKKVAEKIEKGIDKAEKHIDALTSSMDSAIEMGKARVEAGLPYPDLQGHKVYNVHFVEYSDGVKTTDSPVFVASSPEWAFGYCKQHTEAAVKDAPNSWWYYYVTEMAINESAEHWIACIDWNSNIIESAYHLDKGYNWDYKKEHVIFEKENDSQDCTNKEKDEETKIKERTDLAVIEAEKFLKHFFNVKKVIVNKTGGWYKMFCMGQNRKINDYEYDFLHNKFGVGKGNRILFYLCA
jgi:hypothetical protein